MTKAVYPGSLDPITFGHIGAIRDTAEGFGEAIVAIGVNPAKNYMFSLAEREDLARKATAGIPGVTVTSFSGLLVHFLVRNNLNVIVRGVRNGQDLDDNLMQETIGRNQTLARDLKAFYVPARPGQAFTSSTALKGVLKEQGDATGLAPLSTIHATQARMLGQYLYGVTGVSGAGKSSLSRKFVAIAAARGIPLVHIDLDKIGHAILSSEPDPLYEKIRQELKKAFGPQVLDENGFIIRKKLGEIVFGNPDKLKILNDLMHDAVFFRMNDMLRGRKGIFLIDAALLAETGRMSMVNNNIMLVEGDEAELARRLKDRDGLSDEQVQRRLSSQFTAAAKATIIEKSIADNHYGQLLRVKNDNLSDREVEAAFDAMLRQVDLYGEMRITAFLSRLGVADTQAAYTTIRKMYGGDERFYHTLAHVVRGLDRLPDLASQLSDQDAFQLAWLFRGAVHNPLAADNEAQSAALLQKTAQTWGIDAGLAARAAKLLAASVPGAVADTACEDTRLLADLEIASLATRPAEYRQHEESLRREYNALSSREWADRRRDFLQGLGEPCFHSAYFRAQHAKDAAENIKKALAAPK